MAMKMTQGRKKDLAHKLVIYGIEGIGKTTLAMQLPGPVCFIDTEGGTSRYDVSMRMEPETWEDIMETLIDIDTNPAKYGCRTIVIDTMDWAVDLMARYICRMGKKSSIEEFGYGSGYAKMNAELPNLLRVLAGIWQKGINVCLVAHAKRIKFELPEESGSFDKYELKLDQKTKESKLSDMLKEWADTVLFLNYKTNVYSVDKEGSKHKASGFGERVMYTTHHAVWDAKNRDGLPDVLPLKYEAIKHIFENPAPSIESPAAQDSQQAISSTENQPEPQIDPRLDAMMKKDGIEEIFFMDIVKAAFPNFVNTKISDLPSDFIDFLTKPGEWEKLMSWGDSQGIGQPY